MNSSIPIFELQSFTRTSLPLASWLESPAMLYQPPHTHDCFEIVFIRSGSGWCAVNGLRFPVLRGDLYLMTPDDLHEFQGNPGLKFYNLMFSADIFSEEEFDIFRLLLQNSGKYMLSNASCERMENLLAEITSELKISRPANTIAARTFFVTFLVELFRYGNKRFIPVGEGKNSRTISRVFDYIAGHSREKLTLEHLAREIGNTPEYAGRWFKKVTGITFSEYLIRHRINAACGKLENSDASISEIAAELGFFDAAYFDKCFHKILGMTPLAYRRQINKNR